MCLLSRQKKCKKFLDSSQPSERKHTKFKFNSDNSRNLYCLDYAYQKAHSLILSKVKVLTKIITLIA